MSGLSVCSSVHPKLWLEVRIKYWFVVSPKRGKRGNGAFKANYGKLAIQIESEDLHQPDALCL